MRIILICETSGGIIKQTHLLFGGYNSEQVVDTVVLLEKQENMRMFVQNKICLWHLIFPHIMLPLLKNGRSIISLSMESELFFYLFCQSNPIYQFKYY